MYKSTKLFGAMFAGFGALMLINAAFADPTSRASGEVRAGRMDVARMPSMPVMTINPANITADVQQPAPQPQPEPKPEPQPEPQPEPECPDGGVRNSEYTVNHCMNDVLACINNGATPNGMNDLFNEDMRNSIMNGMGLCSIQVEKCMTTVRRDCRPVYRAIADVWVDFNSRKIQPEYYNFVLRKTGLTPNQAENTCLLLDVNTFGPSFAAVDNNGGTTNEYNNRVGAYNNQMGGILIKTNPQGAELNYGNPGVDGARGHYARWDATTATCYLRVAAYNKDEQIKNSWLFGALGNDEPAEVWRAAGDTFSCNKDLFGFGLLNDTKTAAVVGVGGGTLAGAGIGALAGHGKRAFNCSNKSALNKLNSQLANLSDKYDRALLTPYLKANTKAGNLTEEQCDKLVDLYEDYLVGKKCYKVEVTSPEGTFFYDCSDVGAALLEYMQCDKIDDCGVEKEVIDRDMKNLGDIFANLKVLDGEGSNYGTTVPVGAAIGAGTGGLATAITAFVEKNNINCRVGDGLSTVAYGKSHSIDTLKDFYVKWGLKLPDTVIPTATAVDCKTWKLSCAEYTDLNQCAVAAINYKPALDGTITLVRSACAVSGSVCIENAAVAKSYGACVENDAD